MMHLSFFLFFIALTNATTSPSLNRVKKLSPQNTTDLMICITALKYDISNEPCQTMYRTMTGEEYNITTATSIMKNLRQLQEDHLNRKSWYSRMLGLITFSNILLLLITIVAVAFLFAFMGSILLFFAAVAAQIFYRIFLSRLSFYIYGAVLIYLTIGFNYTRDIVGTSWEKYYFLDHYSVVFGSIILGIMTIDIFNTYFHELKNNTTVALGVLAFLYAVISIAHDQWVISTLSVWMVYAAFGFFASPMPGGYVVGFNRNKQLQRCVIISWIIVSFYMAFKIGIIQTEYTRVLDLFENGCLFFGTFIGLLCMLIMSDEYYCQYYLVKNYSSYNNFRNVYYFMQFIMLSSCLVCMFFGTVYSLSIVKGVSGTFIVLHLLDMEYHFLQKFKTGGLTGILFVLGVNLWAVRYYIMYYREYFIF